MQKLRGDAYASPRSEFFPLPTCVPRNVASNCSVQSYELRGWKYEVLKSGGRKPADF